MRMRDFGQLLGRLRQGDVNTLFARGSAGQQKLQREGGLAGAGIALEEVEMIAGQPPAEDVVESCTPGGDALRVGER